MRGQKFAARRETDRCVVWCGGQVGVNYAYHGHPFTHEDWTALLDFRDKNLRGMKVERTFDHFPAEAAHE